ncbi:SRFR1 [Symbiodinium microadriaticum]|nr:SRFR1 [Symbiodinium microadriaticum]
MQQNSGLSRKCIEAFAEVHRLDPTDTQALQFTAICYQGMGDYQSAIKWFDKTLDVDPEHYSWSLREIAYYRWKNLDTPLNEYNPDTDIHWLIKATLAETTAGVNTPHFYSEDRKRQFQVMVLQMAQELMTHISLLRNGKEGLQVPNAARSRRVLVGKQKRDTSEDELDVPRPSEGRGGPGTQTHSDDRTFARGSIAGPIDPLGSHSFSWRDLYDIAVKWRQLGEPFDTVLWIDCTAAQEDKHDKVGLQTFIHHGVGKNIRYYPYFSKIFSLMKKLLPDGCKFVVEVM